MKGKHPRMMNLGFFVPIDRHGMSQLGQPGHGSRMYDNSAMEHFMKTVELMMSFREAQFHVVKVVKVDDDEFHVLIQKLFRLILCI